MILSLLFTIVMLAAQWRVFQKMGRQGWEGIVPIYNMYVLFDVLYNNGTKFLLLLIPFYNIYVFIKLCIDLAARFNKSSGFGIGMALLAPIFWAILGFGSAAYMNGAYAVQGDDAISQALNRASTAIQNGVAPQPTPADQLRQLSDVYQQGLISEEEYNAKREELLKRF